MVDVRTQYKPPNFAELSCGRNDVGYAEWKISLLTHLDWFELRRFVESIIAFPASDAANGEKLAYKRKKIMTYTIPRNSVSDYVREICTEEEHDMNVDQGPKPGCHARCHLTALTTPIVFGTKSRRCWVSPLISDRDDFGP
ncbi:hypothetical protein C7999DRAFT_32534 [Corynascus novoguineensis]|uniref:Uncharacterized protein n=1 Tax=Corynascus novoguineensis TaxID=1126955 RepID=A0AAN7CSI1_9PEZI|nr:hypothetical protein C7999DRAFT_32534 [Corynascus novoguineensis]